MNDYEEKCLALDKQLAELLGWVATPYHDRDDPSKPMYKVPGTLVYQNPRWTQDDAEAFRLAVEHEMDTEWYYSGCSATDSNATEAIYKTHLFRDFPGKVAAMRYAIVQAVINKLKASHG